MAEVKPENGVSFRILQNLRPLELEDGEAENPEAVAVTRSDRRIRGPARFGAAN